MYAAKDVLHKGQPQQRFPSFVDSAEVRPAKPPTPASSRHQPYSVRGCSRSFRWPVAGARRRHGIPHLRSLIGSRRRRQHTAPSARRRCAGRSMRACVRDRTRAGALARLLHRLLDDLWLLTLAIRKLGDAHVHASSVESLGLLWLLQAVAHVRNAQVGIL